MADIQDIVNAWAQRERDNLLRILVRRSRVRTGLLRRGYRRRGLYGIQNRVYYAPFVATDKLGEPKISGAIDELLRSGAMRRLMNMLSRTQWDELEEGGPVDVILEEPTRNIFEPPPTTRTERRQRERRRELLAERRVLPARRLR